MENTKLPWIAEDNGDISNGYIILLEAENSQLRTTEQAVANAVFVIKCVNSHQKLVDALEKISNSPTPFNQRELESWRETCLTLVDETLKEIKNEITK